MKTKRNLRAFRTHFAQPRCTPPWTTTLEYLAIVVAYLGGGMVLTLLDGIAQTLTGAAVLVGTALTVIWVRGRAVSTAHDCGAHGQAEVLFKDLRAAGVKVKIVRVDEDGVTEL